MNAMMIQAHGEDGESKSIWSWASVFSVVNLGFISSWKRRLDAHDADDVGRVVVSLGLINQTIRRMNFGFTPSAVSAGFLCWSFGAS